MRLSRQLFVVFWLMMLVSVRVFADAIGVIAVAIGQVDIVRSAETIRAKTGSSVQLNDVIQTAANSRAQVLLNDQTAVNVGQNAEMKVDEFVFSGTNDAVSVQVAKGAFRFISGKIASKAPERVKVETPLAVIGVRGTEFLGRVGAEGASVALLSGRIEVVNDIQSQLIERPGFGVTVSPAGDISPPVRIPQSEFEAVLSEVSTEETESEEAPAEETNAGSEGSPEESETDEAGADDAAESESESTSEEQRPARDADPEQAPDEGNEPVEDTRQAPSDGPAETSDSPPPRSLNENPNEVEGGQGTVVEDRAATTESPILFTAAETESGEIALAPATETRPPEPLSSSGEPITQAPPIQSVTQAPVPAPAPVNIVPNTTQDSFASLVGPSDLQLTAAPLPSTQFNTVPSTFDVQEATRIATEASTQTNTGPLAFSIDGVQTVDENEHGSAFITTTSATSTSALNYQLVSTSSDAALFTINQLTGEIQFRSAPDFESPADSNSDNVYEFTVAVTNGVDSITQDFFLTVQDLPLGDPLEFSSRFSAVDEALLTPINSWNDFFEIAREGVYTWDRSGTASFSNAGTPGSCSSSAGCLSVVRFAGQYNTSLREVTVLTEGAFEAPVAGVMTMGNFRVLWDGHSVEKFTSSFTPGTAEFSSMPGQTRPGPDANDFVSITSNSSVDLRNEIEIGAEFQLNLNADSANAATYRQIGRVTLSGTDQNNARTGQVQSNAELGQPAITNTAITIY